MQINELSGKMPTIDTLKTAGAIGLLMQQTVAVCDVDANKLPKAADDCSVHRGYETRASINTIDDALGYLTELTNVLRDTYRSLAKSSHHEAVALIHTIKKSGINLIEQQLIAMDGTGKTVYKNASESRKVALKHVILTVSRARSAATDLNHLIQQMTVPVSVYKSNIDKEALKALAEHGTSVLHSPHFH